MRFRQRASDSKLPEEGQTRPFLTALLCAQVNVPSAFCQSSFELLNPLDILASWGYLPKVLFIPYADEGTPKPFRCIGSDMGSHTDIIQYVYDP